MYKIIPSTKDHVQNLAVTMRQVDKDEIWASSHLLPFEALIKSMEHPGECYTALVDNKIICMFGVMVPTFLSDKGVPWLLGSDLIVEHNEFFLRESLEYIKQWKHKYKLLINFVDSRNKVALRWLTWLHFNVYEPEPFGPDNMPFHKFEMRS